MRVFQNAKKRPVYVNGIFCVSMAAGARRASMILGRDVQLWEIQRAANGIKKIDGLDISEMSPQQKQTSGFCKPILPAERNAGPLIRYPLGEYPLDMGLPSQWR